MFYATRTLKINIYQAVMLLVLICMSGVFIGAKNTVSLYRAVSVDEYKQLLSTKNFSMGPNSLEGKFFAKNFEDAQKWGEVLNGPNMSKVIEVKIPKSITDQMTNWEKLDGIGPAHYGALDLLKNVKVELPNLVDEDFLEPNIK